MDINSIKNGIICFTFDDRKFDGWIGALDIFEKYNAYVSFFASGEIDDNAAKAMKILSDKGHTVGLHSIEHADAPEYFNEYGGHG